MHQQAAGASDDHHQSFATEQGGFQPADRAGFNFHIAAESNEVSGIHHIFFAACQVLFVNRAVGGEQQLAGAGGLEHGNAFGGDKGFHTDLGAELDANFRSNIRTGLHHQFFVLQFQHEQIAG